MRRLLCLLLLGLACAAAAQPAGAQSARAGAARDAAADGRTTTPVKHVISLMQENHSFDNYFGTYPGADGIPAGTCMPRDPARPAAGCVRPFHLGGKPISDLGHNRVVYANELAGGKMNGFVSAYARQGIQDPTQAMGHYDDRDLPWYWNVADEFVLFDRHFTSAHGGSISNHMFWVSARTGLPPDSVEVMPEAGFDAPTIFDRLQSAGISWKFYVQNYDPTITFRSPAKGDRGAQVVWVPLLAYPRYLDDPELFRHIVPIDEYYEDLARGTLPAVSYIVPSGASEHPPGSIAAGEAFVRTLVTSLQRSSAWSSSAFMWTYDDWGGWYDHVRPPVVDRYGYGFRAPMLLVSPYAKRGYIDHNTADFTSQLAFIERNWGLRPLTSRDARAYPLTDAFDFAAPPRAPHVVSAIRHPAVVAPPRRHVVYASYASALGIRPGGGAGRGAWPEATWVGTGHGGGTLGSPAVKRLTVLVLLPLALLLGVVPSVQAASAVRKTATVATLPPWTVVHLHGGRTIANSDGWTENGCLSGQFATSDYTNDQQAALLWYHDHAMGITRFNVYTGLAGLYIIRDAEEAALHLPSGPYEIPLLLQDRNLDTTPDGSLTSRLLHKIEDGTMEFFGPFTLVNGTIWPYLPVEARQYRLRMINGSNSRFFRLVLLDEQGKVALDRITQIGTDGGLLGKPVAVPRSGLILAPA